MGEELKNLADSLINSIVKKQNAAKEANKDWGQTINFTFIDIDVGYSLKFAMDGSVELKNETVDDAICSLGITVEDLRQLLAGEINAMDAYLNGLYQIEGDAMSLNKLTAGFTPG